MVLMKTPRSVDISITSKCNQRCTYCSHFGGSGDTGNDLPPGEWVQFLKELNRCAVMDVTLCGGEPFYYKGIQEVISAIVDNKMRFGILSNGSLVNDKTAAFLASTKRCNHVQISIDGPTAGIHDSSRGEGSFDAAVRGIQILRRHKVPVSVRLTINKHNVRHLEEAAAFLLNDLGLPGFSTNSASYMGLCINNDTEIQLNNEERYLAMDTLLTLNKKYNNRISALAGPLAEARGWMKMKKASEQGIKSDAASTGGSLTGCNCVFNKISVRSDGVIIPCSQMAQIELGIINKNDLDHIWQTHPDLKSLRERRNIPLDSFEYCRDCHYIDNCTGNCPAIAYNYGGDIFAPSPDACLKLYLEQGGKLPAENREDV